MNENLSLKFNKGYFYLHGDAKISSDDASFWEKVDQNYFRTQSLKAAAAFRHHSDGQAFRVFDRAFAKQYDLPRLPSLTFLDPHQQAGVRWILSGSRRYLAHPPGAGKTAQLIVASCLAKGEGRTVFIVPPSLTVNWEREIWAFTEPLGVYPTIGIVPTTARRDEMAWRADFLIIPDSMLTKAWVYDRLAALDIKFLGVDEASRFKESTTERGIAFYGGKTKTRVYHGLYQKARHVVFADGSPMPNRPMELWAPTYALDPMAIDCMTQNDFGFRYCGAKINAFGRWEFNHSSNEDELRLKLQKDFMQVIPESALKHPERRRSILFMNEDVRTAEHKSWERRHLHTLSLGDLSEDMNQGEIAKYRRELGIRKIPWIARYVRDLLKYKNESILLFAWHREVCMGLAEALSEYTPFIVIGGTKNETREKGFADFQSGKIKLGIGNIGAMGRGHNLQKADRTIFGEFSWTEELNKQCEKRASRRGRDAADFVRCEYVVSPSSMDEVVLNANFTKEKRTKRIIG